MSDDDYTAVPPSGTATAPLRTTDDRTSPLPRPDGTTLDAPSVTDADSDSTGVSQKAKDLAGSAGDAGSSLLDAARGGASDVKQEATHQVRDLWGQARSEVSEQTTAQQQRLASGLRSFGGQLDQMAAAPDSPSAATDLVKDLGSRVSSAGLWLEDHGPDEVLDELRSFARRRPGTFLLAAAGAGLLVGRLTRALKDAPADAPATTTARSEAPGATVTDPVSTTARSSAGGEL